MNRKLLIISHKKHMTEGQSQYLDGSEAGKYFKKMVYVCLTLGKKTLCNHCTKKYYLIKKDTSFSEF